MKQPKVTIITSLYNCEVYLESYLFHLSQLEGIDRFEILLLHNAPQKNEINIIQKYTGSIPFQHVIIPERESLYRTWNRGIRMAQTEYVCIWNVDDIRFPKSVMEQMATLEENPDALLTYGDFYYMFEYGKSSKQLVINPDFNESNKNTFLRDHHIGCFPMWRKKLHDQYGYFDEQLKLVADLDFQIRLSFSVKLVKTHSVIGLYLEGDPKKLSSNTGVQKKERNLINLRYGIFDFLNWLYIPVIVRKYKIHKVEYNGKNFNIKYPRFFIPKRLPLLLVSIFRQPRFIMSHIKHEIFKK